VSNETPTNTLNNPLTKEYANKLYNSLSGEIRKLESNFISLLVPLISALSVLGWNLDDNLKSCNSTDPHEIYKFFKVVSCIMGFIWHQFS